MKMKFGHHGANHPVSELDSGRVLISSQNHGFAVDEATLPESLRATHRSFFDGSLQGVARTDRPAFGFQGHPEASPGPARLPPVRALHVSDGKRIQSNSRGRTPLKSKFAKDGKGKGREGGIRGNQGVEGKLRRASRWSTVKAADIAKPAAEGREGGADRRNVPTSRASSSSAPVPSSSVRPASSTIPELKRVRP